MAELGPGQERAARGPPRERGWGSRFFRLLQAAKLGEPPFLTRANGGHHAWNSARVFNLALVTPPLIPMEGLPPGRCEGWGRGTPTGGTPLSQRASRASFEAAPSDKKEGYPAVRPDTLR